MNKVCLAFSIGHDRGAALTVNGEMKVAINEERISRIKCDRSDRIPNKSINYCLNALGLNPGDVDLFVYNTTEDINDVPQQFEEMFGAELAKRLEFVPHHLAHAYSTFCGSNFDEAVVVVADAMGSVYNDQTPIKEWYKIDEPVIEGTEWAEGYSIYHFNNSKITPVYKKWVAYPFQDHNENAQASVGYIYGKGALQLVYSEKTNTWQAGKLMGLASYADPEFVNSHPELIKKSDNDMFIPIASIMPEVNYKMDFQAKANAAGLYQREQESASLHLAKMAKNMTGSSNICVSGGSFLNCNSNEAIIKSDMFENQYFVPPADDSGIAIGAAFYGGHVLMGEIVKRENWLNPYLGRTYNDQEIEEAVNQFEKVRFIKMHDIDSVADMASSWLADNKVIGWFQNGSECGPRALGDRSILANPRKKWMVEYINTEIKKREWYRPFAPSVLYERQAEIFELDTYSPYMLVTTTVKPEWRDKIPAVTHFDHTSRYQSVTPHSNANYHKLISAFANKTGIPVVLNTSFNGPEEPIVETPYDAVRTMLKHDLYALVINNYIIVRK